METPNSSESYLLLRDNRKVILNERKFTMGRCLNNSYVVEDMQVSRNHCLLEENNGTWQLTDKSANGTLINENRLVPGTPHVLSSGDKIRLSKEQEFVFINMGKDSLDDINIFDIMQGVEIKGSDHKIDAHSGASKANVDKESALLPSTSVENNLNNDDGQACGGSNTNHVDLCTVKEELNEGVQSSQCDKACDYLDDPKEELRCVICMEFFIKAITLNCAHSFCKHCVSVWRTKNRTCPICRTKITTIIPSIVLDNCIERIMEGASDDVKKKRKEVIKSREEGTPIEISSDEEYNSHDEGEELYDSEDSMYNGNRGWC